MRGLDGGDHAHKTHTYRIVTHHIVIDRGGNLKWHLK